MRKCKLLRSSVHLQKWGWGMEVVLSPTVSRCCSWLYPSSTAVHAQEPPLLPRDIQPRHQPALLLVSQPITRNHKESPALLWTEQQEQAGLVLGATLWACCLWDGRSGV